MKSTRVMAHLTLSGEDFNPDLVTQELSIVPSRVSYKGRPLKHGSLAKYSMWSIDTEWIATLELEEVLQMILQLFQERIDLLFQAAKRHNAHWSVSFGVEVWNEKKPALYFSQPIIQTIAQLEASLDIDYYCYGFEGSEEHYH